MEIFLLYDGEYNWYLNKNIGAIVGYKTDKSTKTYYIANPPNRKDISNYREFTRICDFAVNKGYLYELKCYAVIK